MIRALFMDFASDRKVLDINDEYMFGKSILVCPVTTPMYSEAAEDTNDAVKSEELYLPGSTEWIDFWTGESFDGGQTVSKEVPLDIMPLYVKAGSILPLGPKVQYATEKKWDDLEIRVYEGADGEFTLYEDENDNYNYEKGLYSTIGFHWDNEKRILTIDEREGSFPGMSENRVFKLVLISNENEVGQETTIVPDKEIAYKGKKLKVSL
jgi:alpha-D-xyloside xylohydrolase